MATIAFVVHPERPGAAVIARQAAAWLEERGHTVVEVWDASPSEAHAPTPPASPRPAMRPTSTSMTSIDLAVSLGGDGTMLRTVALACAPRHPRARA